ncbi:MAG: 4Fe-4S cluster-binding domain-containing protein, partial [Elusimicrobiota bacterium]|nr:4Fe-4S cluster-binding domain-containing protein [Elusimicrobiota bacterium]
MIEGRLIFQGVNITINTTEQCNLRCKYCYEVNKKERHIEFQTIKKFINWYINDKEPVGNIDEERKRLLDGLVIDFIGGDSLANSEIIDKTLTYLQFSLNYNNHMAKKHWRSSISTNGTYFCNKKVRKIIKKWKNVLSLGVSIDGCPELHDLNRVFPNGSGSMKSIIEWWPYIQKEFPETAVSTKSTLSKNSIPYLYESLVFMYEVLNITYINQNFIMEENGCNDNDYKLFDQQMEKCCQYILEHKNEIYWSMLDYQSVALTHGNDDKNFKTLGKCGSGMMPALSIEGDIYPCFRWLPISQKDNNEKVMCLGNINDNNGLNKNIFEIVRTGGIRCNCTKEKKCLTCDVESSCPYC